MASNAPEDRLLTAEEVAAYLNLAVGTIYNRVSTGDIPHLKIGRSVRFRRSEIDAWVESRGPADEPAPEGAA